MFRWLQSDSPDATKSHTLDPQSLFHLWCWVKGILQRILFCLCCIWLILLEIFPLAGEQHLILDPLNISLGLPRGFQLLILIFFSGNPSSIIPYGLMAYTAEEANVVNTILNKEKNKTLHLSQQGTICEKIRQQMCLDRGWAAFFCAEK